MFGWFTECIFSKILKFIGHVNPQLFIRVHGIWNTEVQFNNKKALKKCLLLSWLNEVFQIKTCLYKINPKMFSHLYVGPSGVLFQVLSSNNLKHSYIFPIFLQPHPPQFYRFNLLIILYELPNYEVFYCE